MKAKVRIKTKHVHDWKDYGTFSTTGGGGSYSICDGCGSRRMHGYYQKSVVVDGERYFKDMGINRYARKGEPFKDIGRRAA